MGRLSSVGRLLPQGGVGRGVGRHASRDGRKGFLVMLFVPGEGYLHDRAFAFGAAEVEAPFVQTHELAHEQQADAASRNLGIDGVAAPEVHLEELLLLVGRHADARIPHFHAPLFGRLRRYNGHTSAVGRILQRVGEDVLQDGVHLVLVHPHVEVLEVLLVGQADASHLGVFAEDVDGFFQVGAQFVFGHAELASVRVRTLEVDKVGSEAQKHVDVAQGGVDVVSSAFAQVFMVGQVLERRLDEGQRGADVVGGVDEEAYLLVRLALLLAQEVDAQGRGQGTQREENVDKPRPPAEPYGLGDDDGEAPLFEHRIVVLVGDGPYPQDIFAGAQVGEADDVVAARLAPLVVEAFQLPGVEHQRGIVVVDGRHLQGEDVLVVLQAEQVGVVDVGSQRGVLVAGIAGLVEHLEVAEHHLGGVVVGQDHVLVELDGSVGTAEDELAVAPQGACRGVEVLGLEALFLRPVVEGLAMGGEGGQCVLGAQEDASLAVGQDAVDVVGEERAVVLVEVEELLLVEVVDQEARVVGSDVEPAVGRLVEGVDVVRLHGQLDVFGLPAFLFEAVEAVDGAHPQVGGVVFGQGGDVREAFDEAHLPLPVVYLLEVVVAACPYLSVAGLQDGTDVLVGADAGIAHRAGGEELHRAATFVYLVDARGVSARPDDARLHLAERDVGVAFVGVGGVEHAQEGGPLLLPVVVEADAVVGGKPQVAVAVLDDGVHAVVDERLAVADGVLDPLEVGIAVVAHGDADGKVGHPDAPLVVDVEVGDAIAVHGVVAVVVGGDVGFAFVGVGVQAVDARAVGGDEEGVPPEVTDAVDGDVGQLRL